MPEQTEQAGLIGMREYILCRKVAFVMRASVQVGVGLYIAIILLPQFLYSWTL